MSCAQAALCRRGRIREVASSDAREAGLGEASGGQMVKRPARRAERDRRPRRGPAPSTVGRRAGGRSPLDELGLGGPGAGGRSFSALRTSPGHASSAGRPEARCVQPASAKGARHSGHLEQPSGNASLATPQRARQPPQATWPQGAWTASSLMSQRQTGHSSELNFAAWAFATPADCGDCASSSNESSIQLSSGTGADPRKWRWPRSSHQQTRQPSPPKVALLQYRSSRAARSLPIHQLAPSRRMHSHSRSEWRHRAAPFCLPHRT
mmetsp:Transcript_11925/g.41219  ORF Transcript_11925/g.41219 Transcript_11925/m.41219 type:complete len:266 (-) Transcript_11925:198-995(-)